MEALIRHTKPGLVSFLLDAGHAYLAGVEPSPFLRKHAERVDSIHLRSVDAAGRRLPLGEGAPDLSLLAAEIRKLGWAGWLINEPELRTSDTEAALAQIKADREYIRAVLSI